MEGCDQCQRMKNIEEMTAGKLRPNEVLEKPWQHILVDFITKLLVSRGYDSILVVCDRFLKMSHFVMMTEKITAERCHMQVHSSGNYIPIVELPPKHTSLPFTVATFLTTRLMTVL